MTGVTQSAGSAQATPLKIGVIVGSTRPGRKALDVANWVHDVAERRNEATFDVVDIADFDLPHLDEPVPPMAGQYAQEHTKAWAAAIGGYDAYIFVTPEYNHAPSGVLKNAIDYLFAEWNDKAAGFVSYGVSGGVRAVEQLRLVLGELKIADVRATVSLNVFDDFRDHTEFIPSTNHEKAANLMFDDLFSWATAMRTVRIPMSR